ncbi:NADH dehydrogenase 1 beta subcomplex subunit 8 ndufb8 [Blomia tropicalis]|nr:NADH dehydrogenase 1 beta subcomplex subunit 8 ndufb8 [Blomia tropicalis]
MASTLGRLALSTAAKRLAVQSIRVKTLPMVLSVRACGWVRDYKPGPYPRTKEEREAAAAKYNLIPEDYEPYEEGSGFGDYPKLPIVSQDSRNPYDDFDYYYRRRNFGETLHVDYDVLMSEKSNPNYVPRLAPWKMIMCFLASFSFFASLRYIDDRYDLRTASPWKPQQFWKPGVVHYTFEPAD